MKHKYTEKKPILLFKYGGNAMIDEKLKLEILSNIGRLKEKGNDVVVVHGGGPFIKEALKEAKIESEFIDGHRKTTTEAFQYVEMALKGRVNSSIVTILGGLGYKAVGLSGKDGKMVIAEKRMHTMEVNGDTQEVDLGLVGDVASVDPTLIHTLLKNDYFPVITCLAMDVKGNSYNINADMFAGHLAGALEADQYVAMTDVDGLLKDKNDPASIIKKIRLSELQELMDNGIIAGGMIPKVESCEIALKKGAHTARIINGTKPMQLLTSFDAEAPGTIFEK